MNSRYLVLLFTAAMLGVVPRAGLAAQPAPASASAQEQLVSGMTDFGLALHSELAKAGGNSVVSPLSVSIATAMLATGAAGETRAEIAAVARFDLPEVALHAELRVLLAELKTRVDRWAELSFADGVWIDGQCTPSANCAALLAQCYGAAPQTLRFGANPEAASAAINGFVSQRTRGKIAGVVEPTLFDADTRLVLADALYFLGAWAHRFSPGETKEATFYPDSGEPIPVSMMHRSFLTRCYEDDTVRVLELPYQGSGLAMLIALPVSPRKLVNLEAGLSPAVLAGWVAGLAPREVEVTIPRFEVSRQLELVPLLRRLGMRRAFAAETAEFPGLCGDQRIFVDAANHQAVLGITEQGTEAAAATIYKLTMSAEVVPEAPLPFRVDRPFLFVLRDMERGTLLFLGRVVDPRGGTP